MLLTWQSYPGFELGPCALFVSGAGDEARTRDPLLGNYPDAMQAASESGKAAGSMLAATN